MRTRSRAAILLLVMSLVTVACSSETTDTTAGGDEPTATTSAGGSTDETTAPEPTTPPSDEPVTVRAAVTGGEDTLNPYTYVSGFPGWNLLMLQYDSLMQFDAAGEPQPWLAESVEPNDDLTEWTITLVDGVTFNDGEPLTVDDVEFTFNYFVEKAAGRFARDLRGVESVTTDGDLTITVTLAAPNPAFELVALADIPIIPQHIWSEVDNPEEYQFDSVTNVGSGPYVLVDYVEDQSYRFEANPDYFRGVPAVDELVVVVFADDSGPLAAIRSGEIDVIFERISPEQIELLDAADPIDVVQGPEFTTQMINFDVTKAPFDDVAVRQAISLAVDRQDIVDTVFLGAATVGSPGWVHPDKAVYNPAVATDQDLDAANALLDEAGYEDTDGDGIREFGGEPMSFEMLTNSSDSLRLRISELVSEMLAEIGIQVNVASVETATWEEAVWPGFDIANGRNYEMAAWGWSAPIQANTIRVAELVHGDPSIGFLNLTGFSNPDVDALAAQLLTEADETAAAEAIAELQQLIADQVPFVLLAYPDGAYAYNSATYDGWEFIAGQGIVSKVSLLDPSARP
jgi:peptide/nickel transport system substrate-binding protein